MGAWGSSTSAMVSGPLRKRSLARTRRSCPGGRDSSTPGLATPTRVRRRASNSSWRSRVSRSTCSPAATEPFSARSNKRCCREASSGTAVVSASRRQYTSAMFAGSRYSTEAHGPAMVEAMACCQRSQNWSCTGCRSTATGCVYQSDSAALAGMVSARNARTGTIAGTVSRAPLSTDG